MRARPSPKGSYLLVVSLPATAIVEVGSLGRRTFPAGYYVYVGSALGGLAGRLRRHLREKKAPHWHVDYLTNAGPVTEVVVLESEERLECRIAGILKGQFPSVPDFGSSDCRCASHLFFVGQRKELRAGLASTLETTPARSIVLSRQSLRRYLGLGTARTNAAVS